MTSRLLPHHRPRQALLMLVLTPHARGTCDGCIGNGNDICNPPHHSALIQHAPRAPASSLRPLRPLLCCESRCPCTSR
ncbi:hypothetical protein C8R45DRAFT_1068917, partial [Mycena sanguinolenta]